MTYEHFAYLYDTLMKEAPYDQWAAVTEQVMSKLQLPSPATILDLGCGTGEVALRLSARGHDVSGVDISSDMLSVAHQKAIEEKTNIRWVCQDMRMLEGFHEMDVIVSYCDVMNYMLTEHDVAQVFERVAQCLKDDGIFICDVHDDTYAQQNLLHHVFTEEEADITYIWECLPGEETNRLVHELTFFLKASNGMYDKLIETHEQQVFPLSVYERLLKKAGFRKMTFFHDFHVENDVLTEKPNRNFIIAEK